MFLVHAAQVKNTSAPMGAANEVVLEDNRYPVQSPLSQHLSRDDDGGAPNIQTTGKAGWLLEVVDEFGNSTVWNESFPTDNTALAEALNTNGARKGFASVIGTSRCQPPAVRH